MTRLRRIPLNPCDYLYYAHHRMLTRTGRGGSLAYMILDAQGRLPPEQVRGALAAAMADHPVTIAPLRVSRLTGWPYWRIPSSADDAAHRAVDQAFLHEDLRTADDWAARLEESCGHRYTARWNLAAGPNIRFEQYDLPDGRTRFRLLWPHFLMDAEGAQWFLTELGSQLLRSTAPTAPTCGEGVSPAPTPAGRRRHTIGLLPPDRDSIDVLAGRSLAERWRLFRRGFTLHNEQRGLSVHALAPKSAGPLDSLGLLHRHWSPEEFENLKAKAKSAAPPGRATYARHLAACVVKALHRLHREQGVSTDAYLITLPMRPSCGAALDKRPVPGNYLVSPTLCLRAEFADDKRRLGQEILRQVDFYQANDGDAAQWAMIWMASFMRASFYDLIFRLPLGFESLTSGFSYYGEIAPPIRSFGGLPVVNLFGGGPLGTPPAWNPVFSRFQDRLNFSLTWNRPDIPDAVAHRYAELIEQDLFTDG